MYSILHISDLHRTPRAKISNAELVSALTRDRDSYIAEAAPIRPPDAIIVSGDIVQGVVLGVTDGAAKLAAQYEEAGSFLAELAEEFLGGDRSRVIIVPGNHDIDWQIARQAMELVSSEQMPRDVLVALQEPDSPYRWSWATRELFRVVDEALYATRLDAFWRFFASYYEGVDGLLRVAPYGDANLYTLLDGRIGVAAFNSCFGNDCFAFHGLVPLELVSRTHLDLRKLGPFELTMAVWHHNLEGPPYRTDYMDVEVVRAMIGRGFRVGLYGHQHRAQIVAQSIRLAASETMAVLGTGALCAGGSELPDGVHRQYSIIEIQDDLRSARVHVREVAASDLFAPSAGCAVPGAGFTDVIWDQPTNAIGEPIDVQRQAEAREIIEAERLFKTGQATGAAQRLWPLRGNLSGFGRQLLLDALDGAKSWERLTDLTGEPHTIEEFVAGVEARRKLGDFTKARRYLRRHSARLELAEEHKAELENRIHADERLKRK